MDITNIHNPYDFANPVSDKALFIGRKKELDEIKYYLDHAKTAPRPINIALLGPRASGKTSLLNMCELEAKNRSFCIVRVDLDEDDAKSQLSFFYKLFDGIFSTVCELGAFEGKTGKTYDTYLDIVSAYNIPEDKTFCPFLFPLQYAKAMSSNNINAQLSDHNYKSDLLKIRSEINRPIIILFDEGNVLANSRVHLEKIRNIFMNTPGFMLVFTGTPTLFPLMDEVFSPIVRQFKKINVEGFKDRDETKDCVRKPLEKINIDPEKIFDFETYEDIEEIHNLSGGHPYEIQLICHMLFRRVQAKRAKLMKLDLGILEDVRKELETSQDITIRPILTKIRNLRKRQLSALDLLCKCPEMATFEQIWSIEYIFNGNKYWTKEALSKELQYFIEHGIVESKEGVIKFKGDDFDKIYTKYFAREQEVQLTFDDFPLEIYCHMRLFKFIRKIDKLEEMSGPPLWFVGVQDIKIDEIIKRLMSSSLEDVLVEYPHMVEALYFLMLKFRDKEKIPILQMRFVSSWVNIQKWCYSTSPDDNSPIDDFLSKIKLVVERAKEVEGDFIVDKKELSVIPIEVLSNKVEHTNNEMLRNMLANFHIGEMAKEYTEKVNIEEAKFHASLSYRYNPNSEFGNNLGYFFMSIGDLDKARDLLEKEVKKTDKDFLELALPNYNLGILEARCGNFKNALEKIEICIEKLKNTSKKDRECACLFIPKIINEELNFEEIRSKPDLLEVANKAKIILSSLREIEE